MAVTENAHTHTHTQLQARNLDGTDHFADLGVDGVVELHVKEAE